MSISSIDEQPCTYHPDVQTRLRCNKCGTPICPRCSVATPVGYRCPVCANVRGLPTYQTNAAVMVKSTAVGLLIAGAVGVLWGYAPGWQFYLSLLLGFAVAEGMSWAANYKRGADLQVAAIACVVVGLVVSRIMIAQFDPFLNLDLLLNNATDPRVQAAFQVRVFPDLLFAGLAIAIPFVRFR